MGEVWGREGGGKDGNAEGRMGMQREGWECRGKETRSGRTCTNVVSPINISSSFNQCLHYPKMSIKCKGHQPCNVPRHTTRASLQSTS